MLEQLGQPYLLLFLSMAAGAALNCLVNGYSKRYVVNQADRAYYALFVSAVTAAVVAVFIAGDGFRGVSLFTFGMSAAFGLLTLLNFFVHIKALELGPLALTSIFIGASSVIPAIYGHFALGEEITVWQIVGLLLMLASAFFSVEQESDRKRASLKWLAWTLADLLTVGFVGVCQKVHHASPYAGELNEYLFLTFCFVFLYAGGYLLALKRRGVVRTARPTSAPKALWILFFAGVTNGLVNMLNLFLSGVFDAALFYPAVNGGTLTATILLGLILFRERFSRRRWLGIALGVISLCFLLGVAQSVLRQLGVNA